MYSESSIFFNSKPTVDDSRSGEIGTQSSTDGGVSTQQSAKSSSAIARSFVIFLALLSGLPVNQDILESKGIKGFQVIDEEVTEDEAFVLFVVNESKNNHTYLKFKKALGHKVLKTDRVKANDVNNFRHYATPNGITVEVINKSSTISFKVPIKGTTNYVFTSDGKDAGGQQLRLIFTLANIVSGVYADPQMIDFTESPAKATMLMVQLIKGSLQIGQTAQFKGGNASNTDARSFEEMGKLFDVLRKTTGFNYELTLDDSIYTLERKPDVLMEEGTIEFISDDDDYFMADEILMSLIIRKFCGVKTNPVIIHCPFNSDYHINCMIRMGTELGLLEVVDQVDGKSRRIEVR